MPDLVAKLREEVKNSADPQFAHPDWEEIYNDLKELILTADPNFFLRWFTVRNSLHVGAGKASKRFYAEMKKRKDFKYWQKIMFETTVGNPVLLPWDRSTSGTAIAHAHHLARFQDLTGLKITDFKYIFEFGGGYGNMRRMIHRMGFDGYYLMYDMPVLAALQRFYLRSLFIATASLSETPLELRETIKDFIWGFKGILISYIYDFREIDNRQYFKEWTGSEDYEWIQIISDKTRTNRGYLFGRRNE